MAHMVFLGAGHGHLPVLAHAGRFRALGHRVTLVSPGDFYYSGLATGVLAGDYTPAQDRVNLEAFAGRHGVELVRDRAVGLDLARRSIALGGGGRVAYDLLSIAVGSEGRRLPGAEAENVVSIKPLSALLALKARLADAGAARLAIVGGGLAGCEIALVLKSALPALDIALFTRRRIMKGWERAGVRVRAALRERGIALHENAPVDSVAGSRVAVEGGGAHPFDFAILATGLRAPAFLREGGLGVDGMGAVRVNGCLQSLSRPEVFAIGDCMSFQPRPLDKAGVYAIRAAPVLEDNLLARAVGKPLTPFEPQKRYLWIMNLGGGDALAVRPPLLWRGRGAWWLKDYIDRRFVEGFRC